MTENLQSALSDIFLNMMQKMNQEDRETHIYKLIVSALQSGENHSSAILFIRLEQKRISQEGALAFFDSGHPLGNFEIVPLVIGTIKWHKCQNMLPNFECHFILPNFFDHAFSKSLPNS